jgi:hypothetical protein
MAAKTGNALKVAVLTARIDKPSQADEINCGWLR